jgi:hypothetical protein
MVCSISCSISAIFIIGMIYFNNMTLKSKIVNTYKEKLPPNLKVLYDKLSRERMAISHYGYALGFLLSLFIIFYNLKWKKGRLNNTSMICIVMSTCFLTNYFYYMLSPKSDWMLNHINNKELAQAWLQMYREMSFNYHAGLVLGIIAVGIMAFAFRC